MRFGRKTGYALLFIITGLIIGLVIASNFNIQNKSVAQLREVSTESKAFLEKFSIALAEVADTAKPAVVNVSTLKTMDMQDTPMRRFFEDPFFKRFFGEENPFHAPKKYESTALGSGVIVRDDGYILTNSHVVKDADEIKVIMNDKSEYKGKVIGTDAKTDLAVIKIDAKNLPTIKVGDSGKLRPGELVIAIGNPFGLNQTVTMGIVSAVGRSDVGIADYEDFIQIDAAINPGNSGGALVNMNGELVGINTAIFSTSGGYQGIGFAIPSGMAGSVMDSLIGKGKVVRGWLGVHIQSVTPELAKSFGFEDTSGALVADVVEGSPAELAGIKRGDLIMEYAGKKVADTRQFRNIVAGTAPGVTSDVVVLREGQKKTLKVKIGELTDEKAAQEASAPGQYKNNLQGVTVQGLTAAMRQNYKVPEKVTGVIVTGVDEEAVVKKFLRPGDIIQEINKKRIGNIKDYDSVVSGIKPDTDVLLLVYRAGSYIYITVTTKF
jgi:serine protease Do